MHLIPKEEHENQRSSSLAINEEVIIDTEAGLVHLGTSEK